MSDSTNSPVVLLNDHLSTVRLSIEYFEAAMMCVDEGSNIYFAIKMAREAYAIQAELLRKRIESLGGTVDADR